MVVVIVVTEDLVEMIEVAADSIAVSLPVLPAAKLLFLNFK
jgi:hypothetical protein